MFLVSAVSPPCHRRHLSARDDSVLANHPCVCPATYNLLSLSPTLSHRKSYPNITSFNSYQVFSFTIRVSELVSQCSSHQRNVKATPHNAAYTEAIQHKHAQVSVPFDFTFTSRVCISSPAYGCYIRVGNGVLFSAFIFV